MRTSLVLFLLFHFFSTAAQDATLQELVQQHAREIYPAAADFKGLSFLDTLLKDKRIVMLGESSHGTEEYSQLKFQLIQYLHEKLGFNVLLFESPMTNASYVNTASDTAAELVRNSIQSVWHTETISRLFGYIKNSRLQFGGFDPQFMYSSYPALLYAAVFNEYPAIKGPLLQLENRIAATIKNPSHYLSLKDSFSLAYAALALQLGALPLSPAQQWMRQIITTNISYYSRIKDGDQRDSCMASNIIWLADHLYANEKIIIWAHNTHIDKSPGHKKIMGKLLAAHFKDALYGIGLFMVNGATALNNRTIIAVKPAPRGSLEAVVADSHFRYTFMKTGFPAFDHRMPAWHWGKDKQVLNPSKSFDAVIVVNGVRAPEYLKK